VFHVCCDAFLVTLCWAIAGCKERAVEKVIPLLVVVFCNKPYSMLSGTCKKCLVTFGNVSTVLSSNKCYSLVKDKPHPLIPVRFIVFTLPHLIYGME